MPSEGKFTIPDRNYSYEQSVEKCAHFLSAYHEQKLLTMKKNLFSLLLALLLSATAVFAQQTQSQSDTTPGGRNQGQMMHEKYKMYLKDSVQLSSALVDSVMNLRMEFQPQLRDIYMNQSLSDADRQTRLGDIRIQQGAKYQQFGLTPVQVQRINDYDMRMSNRLQNHPPGASKP